MPTLTGPSVPLGPELEVWLPGRWSTCPTRGPSARRSHTGAAGAYACPCKPGWSAMVSTESGSAVKLTGHRTQQTDDSDISFPPLESWNPLTKVATIAAQVGGKRVLCRISMEVLKKRFRASASEPMQSVSKNRELIRDAARKLIESNAYEKDGSILIRQKDI